VEEFSRFKTEFENVLEVNKALVAAKVEAKNNETEEKKNDDKAE
jgi:hypothetical protein